MTTVLQDQSYVDSLYWVPKSQHSARELREKLTLVQKGADLYDPNAEDLEIYMWRETDTHIGVPRTWGFRQFGRVLHDRRPSDELPDSSQFRMSKSLGGPGREKQQWLVDHTCESLRRNVSNGTITQAPPGYGKCLAPDTKVLLYNGTVVRADEVQVGNWLMGPDGGPREVISTCRGRGPMYRITPVKGEPWSCNDIHVLTLIHTSTGEVIDIPLNEYLEKSKWWKSRHKQFSVGVDFPWQPELPLDPYFLGLWLGDGSKGLSLRGVLRGVAITKGDYEVSEACSSMALKYGLKIRVDAHDGRCPTHHIHTEWGSRNLLLDEMRSILGPDLSIPQSYLTSSRDDRLSLLAGLLDSDGHLQLGCFDFVNKRLDYVESLVFVARSLGLYAAEITPKVVSGETYWRTGISGNTDIVPCRISRKRASPRRQVKDATRTGFSVESLGRGDYSGFELNGDGRFLLGNFTVTHNTVCGVAIAAEMKVPTIIVVHKEFLRDQWLASLQNFTTIREDQIGIVQGPRADWEGKSVVIAMMQSLINKEYPEEFWSYFGLLMLDETHRVAAPSWAEVTTLIPAKYRVGLTATPRRKDGLMQAFLWSVGMVDTEVEANLVVPEIYQIQIPAYCPLIRDKEGKPMASKMLSLLMGTASETIPGKKTKKTISRPNPGSNKRDAIVVQEVAGALEAGRKVLVLSDRIPHLERMGKALQAFGGWSQDFYIGGRAKGDRDIAEKAQCIWATYAMAQEGLDIPAIDTVVLAGPKGDVEQTVGRAMRPYPGKERVLVIDIWDSIIPFEGMGHRRSKFYAQKGWKVTRQSRG